MKPGISFAALALLALFALLSACATIGQPALKVGQSLSEVTDLLGKPTSRYAMPGGTERIEFASGPMGRRTWMVNLDAGGHVSSWYQALEEWRLHEFQQQGPGMPRDEVLRLLGRPGERRVGGFQGGELWNYRFPTNECFWFQVSLGDDGRVRDGTFGIDPRCDAGRGDSAKP